jgi:(1->4)-alpha-D-glucan 1-alpha-D-glucosylmutase
VSRLCRTAHAATGHPDPQRLREALVELLVAVDVYRAYVRPGAPVDVESAHRLEEARRRAVDRRPDLTDDVDLLVRLASDTAPASAAAAEFAVRLQQTCGPVMAKGIEDTTFYRWHRLVALNEVGGDPGVLPKASPDALHAWAGRQQEAWPLGMTTLSTHDTKRSEDVRARLLALAQHPQVWQESAAPFLQAADEHGVDRPTAVLVWQTLLGAWPVSRERLHEYLRKALREAKQHTAWVDGDAGYEERVLTLADQAQTPGPLRAAVESALAATVDDVHANVLATKLLQLCLPGVPDVYQGSELVTDSLVDPDNRRPVDYDRRARLLARLDGGAGTDALDLDALKLLVTSRALRLRRRQPEAFGRTGGYQPLDAPTEHVLGFLRGDRVACVVTRASARLRADGGWGEHQVRLPGGTWRDVLTGVDHDGGPVRCADLMRSLPVALLERR